MGEQVARKGTFGESSLQKIGIGITIVALGFLAFVAGATITRFELFPYGQLKNAFDAAEALFVRETGDKVPFALGAKPVHPEDWAAPAVRVGEPGVDRYEPDLAFNGYTIYTPVTATYPIRLIDMSGQTVHQWYLPFDDLVGEREDGLSLQPPNNQMTIAYARLFPNGDLLAVLGATSHTPWGFGIVKLDKDSNIIWKFLKQAHHDVDVGPDGKIYAALHTVETEAWPELTRIRTPFIDDQVVVLNPDGEELQSVSILAAVLDSDYQSILQFADPNQPKGDFLHLNSINYLDVDAARAFPGAEAGDVLISLRQIDVLAVLDIAEKKIKWAVRGPWRVQHDPDILPNGRMLVFDNRGDLKNGGTSRVLEFDPATLEIVWEYPDNTDERLYTSIYGSQQRLPNGNTLISESNNGRLLEVTRDKQVVWEYRIPERTVNRKGDEVATAVFAERFAAEELEFLKQ